MAGVSDHRLERHAVWRAATFAPVGRTALLGLSVVDCGFGALYLTTSGSLADAALLLNFLFAALLTVLTWQDLRARDRTWPAPVTGLSYLLAPLVGLVLYAAFSNRPRRADREMTAA